MDRLCNINFDKMFYIIKIEALFNYLKGVYSNRTPLHFVTTVKWEEVITKTIEYI